MDWEVTVRMNGTESTYAIEADRYYEAKMSALTRFLEENRIPGSPTEYLTKKKGLVEVSVRSREDRRRRGTSGSPTLGEEEFYVEQVDKLRKLVREGELLEEVKVEVSGLLFKVREVLVGQ